MSPIRIRSLVFALAALFVTAACQDAPTAATGASPLGDAAGPAAAKGGQKTSVKFTFEDVTLVDGDLVVENAVIEVGSRDKKNPKQDWTQCDYFTEGWREHLGAVGTGDFASTDADDLLAFCLASFPDRQ